MKDERLKYLIHNYLVQDLTEEESLELDDFIKSNPALTRSLEQNKEALNKAIRRMASIDVGSNLQKVLANIHLQDSRKPTVRMGSKWTIAASIAVFLAVAIYFVATKTVSIK